MKKILFFLVILLASPVYSACLIDEISGACVAEFNSSPEPNIMQSPNVIKFDKTFQGIENTTPISREIQPTKSLRQFGPTSQDYNYNSSCQFGICRTTGTPTSITGEKN